MSSILTNNSAMNALATMRNINNSLDNTQNRISTGLKINSAKDNAAMFAISEGMKGDSSMTKALNENLTLTKNSVATARVGADMFKDLASQFSEKVLTAQNNEDGLDEIETDLKALVETMKTTLSQATFNGDDLVNAAKAGKTLDDDGTDTQAKGIKSTDMGTLAYVDDTGAFITSDANTAAEDNSNLYTIGNGPKMTETREVVTGISRIGDEIGTTSIKFQSIDLYEMMSGFEALAENFKENAIKDFAAVDGVGGTAVAEEDFATTAGAIQTAGGKAFLANALKAADDLAGQAVKHSTNLGIAEKSIESQQDFLSKLSDNLDSGVGAMVDANMEEEAARLQALQVQQQLATQSLTMANQKPQNILGLFR